MDDRIIQFIDALRGAGVRVSVAESADALRAIEATGINDKDLFRLAMRATLVKESHDIPEFEKLFPSFFGSGAPPMPNQPGGGMSQEDRDKMAEMLEQMLQNMTPEQLRELFEAMMTGQNMSREQMQQMLEQNTNPGQMTNPYYQPWMARRAMRELEFDRLDELLQELMEKLREAGLNEETIQQMAQEARENQNALAEQIAQEVGANMHRRAAEERRQQPPIDELLDRPFD
ncbi:CoxE, partial [Kouleothrix aurantiaca]